MTTSKVFREISTCRICSSGDLEVILDLGVQGIASIFPHQNEPDPPLAPLTLVRCPHCSLVQLLHSVLPDEMYTYNYGYRSGTNATMRGHLAELSQWCEQRCALKAGDIVLDIGCNDGTLLKSYRTQGLRRVGIDAIAGKFRDQYPETVQLYEGFFSGESYRSLCGQERAQIITSIAMFYDLEAPVEFVSGIASSLAAEGIWVLEQSYLPTMLETNSFDTICHEHLEYYGLHQIEWMARACGMRVFDVELNDSNGGSFRLAVCHENSSHPTREDRVGPLRKLEDQLGLDTRSPFDAFKMRIDKARDALTKFVTSERKAGKKFYLYGASTKGNTLLQYYKLDGNMIIAAAERNPEKWGCRTPLTNIPIQSEEECRAAKPDYFLVLPWHFRREFVEREKPFLQSGGKLVFPLPDLEIV
jgi:NDP-4-keto-2,6-dideoxyhexose 3-C-methyltransferase